MLNKVMLIGRLGRDPETRFTSSGKAVANFTIATDETYTDASGQKQKKTEWSRCVAWGKTAEIAQQYLKKGSLVYIEGKLQSREWEDKRDGAKKTVTEIVVGNLTMLGGKPEGQTTARPQTQSRPAPKQQAQGQQFEDEDIPF